MDTSHEEVSSMRSTLNYIPVIWKEIPQFIFPRSSIRITSVRSDFSGLVRQDIFIGLTNTTDIIPVRWVIFSFSQQVPVGT